MATKHVVDQRNPDATCFVGGLADEVDDDLLWELFTQVGPVVDVHIPKDSVTGQHRVSTAYCAPPCAAEGGAPRDPRAGIHLRRHACRPRGRGPRVCFSHARARSGPASCAQGFAFVELRSAQDAEYACRVLAMLSLCGKPIRVDRSSAKREATEVGAKLYIGGLSPEADEKALHDTFSAFGHVVGQPRVQHDAETGAAKGFGFVEFASFDAADRAIEAMNGQHLAGRPLTVQYSYRRDQPGVRHGSQAERIMAAARAGGGGSAAAPLMPHTRFAGDAALARPPLPHAGVAAGGPGMPGHGGFAPRGGFPGGFAPRPPFAGGAMMPPPGFHGGGYGAPPPLPYGMGAGGYPGGGFAAGGPPMPYGGPPGPGFQHPGAYGHGPPRGPPPMPGAFAGPRPPFPHPHMPPPFPGGPARPAGPPPMPPAAAMPPPLPVMPAASAAAAPPPSSSSSSSSSAAGVGSFGVAAEGPPAATTAPAAAAVGSFGTDRKDVGSFGVANTS